LTPLGVPSTNKKEEFTYSTNVKENGSADARPGGERRAIRGQPFSFTQNGKRNSFVFSSNLLKDEKPLSHCLSGRLCSTEFLPPLGSSSCG
jgi:hypothetical protein